MRTLAWILALAALAVAVSLAAAGNGGYVLVVLPPWRVELSLNLLVMLLLLGFGVGHGLLRLLALGRSLPMQVRRYRAGRARQEGEQALHQALRLFYEGRYGHALKQAAVAAGNDHAPALASLVAARAAHAMQERDKEIEWLQRAAVGAEADDSVDSLAVLMTTAELAVESRRYDDALVALQRVHRLRGRHIAALRLELRARQGLRQWDEVLRLVRQLEKRGALLPELAREQRYRAHRENLRQRQHDAVALQAYRATIPAEEIGPRMTVVLADALLAAGLPDEAAAAIERQLAKDFDAELLQRYGRLPVPLSAEGSPDTAVLRQRLAVAERWLAADSQHSHEPELLVALGRLCLALRLWGKAQSYLEAALSLRDERGTHLELARLAEALGRQDEAERHYRQSARMS